MCKIQTKFLHPFRHLLKNSPCLPFLVMPSKNISVFMQLHMYMYTSMLFVCLQIPVLKGSVISLAFFPFNNTLWLSFQVSSYIFISIPLNVTQHFIIWIYHNLYNQSPLGGHFIYECFLSLIAKMKHTSLCTLVSFCQDLCLHRCSCMYSRCLNRRTHIP